MFWDFLRSVATLRTQERVVKRVVEGGMSPSEFRTKKLLTAENAEDSEIAERAVAVKSKEYESPPATLYGDL